MDTFDCHLYLKCVIFTIFYSIFLEILKVTYDMPEDSSESLEMPLNVSRW